MLILLYFYNMACLNIHPFIRMESLTIEYLNVSIILNLIIFVALKFLKCVFDHNSYNDKAQWYEDNRFTISERYAMNHLQHGNTKEIYLVIAWVQLGKFLNWCRMFKGMKVIRVDWVDFILLVPYSFSGRLKWILLSVISVSFYFEFSAAFWFALLLILYYYQDDLLQRSIN